MSIEDPEEGDLVIGRVRMSVESNQQVQDLDGNHGQPVSLSQPNTLGDGVVYLPVGHTSITC